MAAGNRSAHLGEKMEVTFIRTAGDSFEVRMVDNSADTIIRAAETLKARYVVLIDEISPPGTDPIWSVFDMKGVQKMMGNYVFPLAVKTFQHESNDGAVMWAAAMMGKS